MRWNLETRRVRRTVRARQGTNRARAAGTTRLGSESRANGRGGGTCVPPPLCARYCIDGSKPRGKWLDSQEEQGDGNGSFAAS
jgi:hypothetical protein